MNWLSAVSSSDSSSPVRSSMWPAAWQHKPFPNLSGKWFKAIFRSCHLVRATREPNTLRVLPVSLSAVRAVLPHNRLHCASAVSWHSAHIIAFNLHNDPIRKGCSSHHRDKETESGKLSSLPKSLGGEQAIWSGTKMGFVFLMWYCHRSVCICGHLCVYLDWQLSCRMFPLLVWKNYLKYLDCFMKIKNFPSSSN